MKPSKCLAKEKNRPRKAKAEGRRGRKKKSQHCSFTFKPKKNYFEILLSVRAQTLEAGVLCLEQNKQGFGLGF